MIPAASRLAIATICGVLFGWVACSDGSFGPQPPGGSPTEGAIRLTIPPLASVQLFRVSVSGPTSVTVDFTPNADGSLDVTIDDLAAGSYRVIVEGLIGDEVELFGRTDGVQVTPGNVTTVTLAFGTFRPVVAPPQSPTVAFSIAVDFTRVPAAEGYQVETADDMSFANSQFLEVLDTSAIVIFPEPGTFYVRVRAVSSLTTAPGRPSDPESVTVLTDLESTGGGPAIPLDLGFGTAASGRLVGYNIYPVGDEDLFALDLCAADTITVETFTERLSPPSALDPVLQLQNSAGDSLAASDDAVGLDARFEVVAPTNDTYVIVVSGFGQSVGHYETEVTVRTGPNNSGAACTGGMRVAQAFARGRSRRQGIDGGGP